MFENYFCLTLIQKGQLQLPQPLQQAAVLSQHVSLCIFTLAFPFDLIQLTTYLEGTCESSRSHFAVLIFFKFSQESRVYYTPACLLYNAVFHGINNTETTGFSGFVFIPFFFFGDYLGI